MSTHEISPETMQAIKKYSSLPSQQRAHMFLNLLGTVQVLYVMLLPMLDLEDVEKQQQAATAMATLDEIQKYLEGSVITLGGR